MEPHKLKHWRLKEEPGQRFFSCARPGRSFGPDEPVADAIVVSWLKRLPPSIETIVSLLGMKPKPRDIDEHSFYSFFGSGTSFETWLNSLTVRTVEVVSLPTVDFEKVSDDVVVAARRAVASRANNTVLLLDSGGEQRSGFVCRQMGAVEVFGE